MQNAFWKYRELLFAKAGGQGIPLSGTFELTARCNLDCRMCYIHKRENDRAARERELSTEQWLSLAKECQQAGTLLLLLTGGEPLLRPDFREIYTGCRRLGMMVSINSNATLIDERMVEFFASDPPSRINITLYGASPETYGRLCGDPSAYERVVKAILALQAAGVLVKLNFSITPYNRQDAVKVYQFAKDHGLAVQAASYMFPPVRACEQGCYSPDRMTPEEAAQAQMDAQAQAAITEMNYAFQNYEQERTDAFDSAVAEITKARMNALQLNSGVKAAVNENLQGRTARLLVRATEGDTARAVASIKDNYSRKSNEIDLNKESTYLSTKSYINNLNLSAPKMPSRMQNFLSLVGTALPTITTALNQKNDVKASGQKYNWWTGGAK